MCDWGSSSVRSTIGVEVVLFFLLDLVGGFAMIDKGFGIVGSQWEWGPTTGIEVMRGL